MLEIYTGDSHNPDILNVLSNLSGDEGFTSPEVANKMLDTLPDDIWTDDKIKFLDPAMKSGVFLREITNRLLDGLEEKIPDIQQRLEHILKNQVYGVATTKLTSEISRRTLYCSKKANNEYSIVEFDSEDGNLKFFETEHFWADGKTCKYCGMSRDLYYNRGKEFEDYSLPYGGFPSLESPFLHFSLSERMSTSAWLDIDSVMQTPKQSIFQLFQVHNIALFFACL